MVGVFVAFIRVVYGRTIYMSLPINQREIDPNIVQQLTRPKNSLRFQPHFGRGSVSRILLLLLLLLLFIIFRVTVSFFEEVQ